MALVSYGASTLRFVLAPCALDLQILGDSFNMLDQANSTNPQVTHTHTLFANNVPVQTNLFKDNGLISCL